MSKSLSLRLKAYLSLAGILLIKYFFISIELNVLVLPALIWAIAYFSYRSISPWQLGLELSSAASLAMWQGFGLPIDQSLELFGGFLWVIWGVQRLRRSEAKVCMNQIVGELYPSSFHHVGNLATAIATAIGCASHEQQAGRLHKSIEYWAIAQLSSSALVNTCKQLLVLDRTERLNPPKRRIDLVEFLGAIARSFEPRAHTQGKLLTANLTQVKVLSSPELLEQIIYELLTNAIKYTPEYGSISIECDRSGVHWRISISNTGLIPAADRERVFELGYRSKPSLSDGTGMGLYFVRALCDRLDIDISLKCEEGNVVFLLEGEG